MIKKKRIIILLVTVLVLLTVFLLMLFNRLYDGGFFQGNKDGFTLVSKYDLANFENNDFSNEGEPIILIPTLITEGQGSDSLSPEIQNSTTKKIDYPEPFEQIDFRPIGDSAQQQEQIIKVGALGFEPREIFAVYPSKVVLTFEVLDNNEHKIVFEGSNVSQLSFSLDKNSQFYTKTFLSPEPGTYSFYIDNQDNRGVFRVLNK